MLKVESVHNHGFVLSAQTINEARPDVSGKPSRISGTVRFLVFMRKTFSAIGITFHTPISQKLLSSFHKSCFSFRWQG